MMAGRAQNEELGWLHVMHAPGTRFDPLLVPRNLSFGTDGPGRRTATLPLFVADQNKNPGPAIADPGFFDCFKLLGR